MKKSIAILLVAVLAIGSISAYADELKVTDSATTIKKAATAAIKAYDPEKNPNALKDITDLLGDIGTGTAKEQAVILNAIKQALNTATLKKDAPAAVEALNAACNNITITKAAGGKWNITVIETDTQTGSVIKEDIPKAAVERPTLSTDPTVNSR